METAGQPLEVAVESNAVPKYNEQTATIALGGPIAPLEEVRQDNLDSLEVPRRKRSDIPRRRPGTAWYDSYQLSGSLPAYSGYASPSGTAAMAQAGSLKPEDEEEIAAALFDLAKTSREARSGLLATDQRANSLILPSSRKRPRKPSRAGIKYETNYATVFDEDWDAEDEYLAKRRGVERPINTGGYPMGPGGGRHPNGGGNRPPYNNHAMFQNGNLGYPMQPPSAPMNSAHRFKPGPNHVAISHFIQWHRQMKSAPPQQPQYAPPPSAGSNFAAAAAAALGRAQGISHQNTGAAVRPPGNGLDISALAAILPSLQAGMRQQQSANGGQPGNQLAGLLGQLVGGQQGNRQLSPETLNILQQLLRRQQAQRQQQQQQQQQQQPPLAMAQPAQGVPNNLPANLASVVARLKNAQAKAQGVAMAAAATQARPAMTNDGNASGGLQNPTNGGGQSEPAFLQSLKAMLAANAQHAQQGMAPVVAPPAVAPVSSAAPSAPLPPSHAELLKVMKQSLEMAKSNNIGAWVAKKYQLPQQEAHNGTDSDAQLPGDSAAAAAGTIAPVEAPPSSLPAPSTDEDVARMQIKTENNEIEENIQPSSDQQQQLSETDKLGASAAVENEEAAQGKEILGKQVSSDPIPSVNNGNGTDPSSSAAAAAMAPVTAPETGSGGSKVEAENNDAPTAPSVPPFQPAPMTALEAMRAFLLRQMDERKFTVHTEDRVDTEKAAEVVNEEPTPVEG